MGIKLDWQVESEQSQVRASEDPDARLHRQHLRRQFLAVLAGLVVVLGGVGGVVVWRLWSVDHQIRQDLLDTVEIEVTALRIGDFANYMAIQRSASDAFMLEQSRQFDEYQRLKQTHRVELTGKVISVTIDDQRGRVVLQEIIDGVPYQVVWFYWRYEDVEAQDQSGWRHVPDDLTFWGEAREIEQGDVTISYHALDERLARALAPRLSEWWADGCPALSCALSSGLRVEIVAERPKDLAWSTRRAWTLSVTSPLVGRSRADLPLSPDLESEIATLIAARLVSYASADLTPLPYSDAAWLQSELARWLAASFLGTSGTGFTDSLRAIYGDGVPARLLEAIRTGATLDATVTGIGGVPLGQLSLDQLNSLDWRGFFQWRLEQEAQLATQPDSLVFLTLYDPEDVSATNQALLRFSDPAYAAQPVPQVKGVTVAADQGKIYAYVAATSTDALGATSDSTILWRLVGGTWKRAS